MPESVPILCTESVHALDEFRVTDTYLFGQAYNFESKVVRKSAYGIHSRANENRLRVGARIRIKSLYGFCLKFNHPRTKNGHGFNARIRPNSLYGIRPRSIVYI